MYLRENSNDIHENFLAPDFRGVAGDSHAWVLEELSGGYVILPAVPRTSDNRALERPLAERTSPVQASIIDSKELAGDVRKRKHFAPHLEFVNGACWNIGNLGG
jgi:hypothetical protein